jgi:hypothetical protein
MHSKLGAFLECAMAYKEAGSMYEKAERPNGALCLNAGHNTKGAQKPAGGCWRRRCPVPRLQRRVRQP